MQSLFSGDFLQAGKIKLNVFQDFSETENELVPHGEGGQRNALVWPELQKIKKDKALYKKLFGTDALKTAVRVMSSGIFLLLWILVFRFLCSGLNIP